MERDQHQEICNDGGLLCESKEVSVNNHNSDAVEESEDTITSGNQEVSPANGPTLPILQKIIDCSDKIKVLLLSLSSS
jgi:kinesin family protein C2/C3